MLDARCSTIATATEPLQFGRNPARLARLLKEFGVTEADTPVVACAHTVLLRNPSNQRLANEIGIHHALEQTVFDLLVAGAGPAGLAAAVHLKAVEIGSNKTGQQQTIETPALFSFIGAR
ncbi:MAG: hypothetical protein ACJ74Z_06165 [Bryobacteraceae bacterium]